MPAITLFFVAISSLMAVALGFNVIAARWKHNVSLGDGGHPVLQQRIRAHGNFVEYMPLALLALSAAELTNNTPAIIWVLGLVLLTGRVCHAVAILRNLLWPRSLGMILTVGVMMVCSVMTLVAILNVW